MGAYLEELRALRQRVAIGVRHGLAEAVLAYFDQPLALPQASHALRYVAALEQAQAEIRRRQLAHTGFFKPTPEVEAAQAAFEPLRSSIVQRLYELIEHHIGLFS